MEHGRSDGGLSQPGDRPELAGDKERDQISELLSAQFNLAAVVRLRTRLAGPRGRRG